MADDKKLQVVASYIKHRDAQENDAILAICSDDIKFTDSHGKVFNGKADFQKYLKDPPPPSRWETPELQPDGHITVKGQAQKMYMWWNVEAEFLVTDDKITELKVSRK